MQNIVNMYYYEILDIGSVYNVWKSLKLLKDSCLPSEKFEP